MLGGLLRPRHRAVSAVVREREPPGEVLPHRPDAVLGRQPAVAVCVRQGEQVGGEPVAAEMGGLPGEFRPALGEGGGQRASALGAAGVVPAVGADQQQRLGVRLEADAVRAGDLDAARAAWLRVFPLLDACLSVNYIAAVKTVLRAETLSAMQLLAQRALAAGGASEVRAL